MAGAHCSDILGTQVKNGSSPLSPGQEGGKMHDLCRAPDYYLPMKTLGCAHLLPGDFTWVSFK